MTQEEKWLEHYNEVVDFIETNHRNPSRHFVENRNLLSWIKQQRKLLNAGALKPVISKETIGFHHGKHWLGM